MLSASLYQGHYAGNHKLLNINGDIYTQYAGAAGMLLHTIRNVCVTNDHGYVPSVLITIEFCSYRLITGFVT
jgi:hypothetical protein